MDVTVKQRERMVKEQIMARGITDDRVLAAMLKVPRHHFVPEDSRAYAHEDYPLDIGFGQTISQPFIVAYMLEVAKLQAHHRVLEIGTGSGYQTALLAELAQEVYSLDIIGDLIDAARTRLEHLAYQNTVVIQTDGYEGLAEKSPYDVIIVSAAPKELPEHLLSQLKVGGRMVVPLGGYSQQLYLVVKTASGSDQRSLLPVRFVPMVRG